ncbi:GerAB/ArcD/ProY family transporter [Priestia sp. SIMBA_032]|uniref:GerAB/ArcD/ProY family transporter n=1 Tax=Priestia sp. SIMBA_032 TaxID=3085775 RepID=UPI00397A941D
MITRPTEKNKVSPYFAFFLVSSAQINVGLFGFQRYIAKDVGQDAWLTVLLVGLAVHVLIWICYQILNKGGDDIISIHYDLFGKWIGGLLNFIIILYFLVLVIIWTRTYVEVIQVWMTPFINQGWIVGLILILAYYYVSGGFRVVTGLAFFSGIIITIILFTLYFPIKEAHFHNLLPIFDHSIDDQFNAMKEMVYSYLGFEFILIFYPFLSQSKKSQKWSHLGVLFTMLIYIAFIIVSLAYYNLDQLYHTVWATLTLWQEIKLPFIERFEYVGISLWLFLVLPGICLGLWASSRSLKKIFHVNQHITLLILICIVFVVSNLITDRQQINMYTKLIKNIGAYIIFLYIPLLFFIQAIVYKVRKNKK